MNAIRQKQQGAYYTPDAVVRTLVKWAVVAPSDRLLDPSCGDGRFLMEHANCAGVEDDPDAATVVHNRLPGSLIHKGDFFSWAASTRERFECAAGNPPFIRYQRFAGRIRDAALGLCANQGAAFTGLSSSWAPFLVGAASLLKAGGRLAFVVPAEIGHAPYAVPLLEYLVSNFGTVKIVAIQEKLFPELSEDCWLLFCSGFGGRAQCIELARLHRFSVMNRPPQTDTSISLYNWRQWGCRIRPFLLPSGVLDEYRQIASSAATRRLSEVARVGIGYVTGANDFFHLRPSAARRLGIARSFLVPAVRNGRDLAAESIDDSTVRSWLDGDRPNFLLRLRPNEALPSAIRDYLGSDEGNRVRTAYKCRVRNPWYVVPHVKVPDGFLSYMCGAAPSLVVNRAQCVGANSVHVVQMKAGHRIDAIKKHWDHSVTQLSCEIEGHPLGGGMLKLEPREAGRVVVCVRPEKLQFDDRQVAEAAQRLRQWRHYG